MTPKNIPLIDLIHEIAIHEASHFVIDLLIKKDFPVFYLPEYIYVKVVEGETLEALVYGAVPKAFKLEDNLSQEQKYFAFIEFYTNNPNGVYLKCLKLLSGYNSYKFFIENTNEYIGLIDQKDALIIKNTNIVRYFDLKNAPTNIMITNWTVKDITDCYEKLGYNGLIDKESKDSFLSKMINDLDEIMSIDEVQESIKIVAMCIKKNNGNKIEGEYLDDLVNQINQIINDISIQNCINIELFNNT